MSGSVFDSQRPKRYPVAPAPSSTTCFLLRMNRPLLSVSLPSFGLAVTLGSCLSPSSSQAARVLVEAESFAQTGGWILDTQFIEIMGSPYLMAHGLGRPVKDAETKVSFPAPGKYRVFARTKDWVAPWKAPGSPGRFQLVLNGQPQPHTYGTTGAEWFWEAGGEIEIPAAGEHTLALRDLTGFNGRCDALFFTSSGDAPPESRHDRKVMLGLPDIPESKSYDLVVCGGGYSGLGAAISAARQGLRVALIQNRPVLGGNGSSEVQVWAQGGTRRGLYPELGGIVDEFADKAPNSPGLPSDFGDDKKEALVRAEKNIDLFLNTHVIGAEAQSPDGQRNISAVLGMDTRTGAETRFAGKFFVDCTGHGTVGALAGARFEMLEKGHMGMSNMWTWTTRENARPWPEAPWVLPLSLGDFPNTPKAKGPELYYKGEWFWEGGFNKHPIKELELVRDWNLRAVFGAFNAKKTGMEKEKFAQAEITWVAAIGGPRESRLLTGDVVLTRDDIVKQKAFPDGCVPTTWDIDIHYPKEQYAKNFPDNPFISKAEFGSGVDRKNGYPVPYRCLYSANVGNLFMAGRCISVTHEALGTVRVMKTCGMMGEVVGKAAFLCVTQNTSPRGVYEKHLEDLKELMRQPASARRENLQAPLVVPPGQPQPPKVAAAPPANLEGIVVDDSQAELTGKWNHGNSLEPHIGSQYLYAGPTANATARFAFTVPKAGLYEVRIAWVPHENRSTKASCVLETAAGPRLFSLNQREKTSRPDGFHSLGTFEFDPAKPAALILATKGSDGNVHADGIQVVAAK